jgi:hypothetical protein
VNRATGQIIPVMYRLRLVALRVTVLWCDGYKKGYTPPLPMDVTATLDQGGTGGNPT